MQKLRGSSVRAVAILALAAIAGCGADGEPVPPTKNAIAEGLSLSRVYTDVGAVDGADVFLGSRF